ncbi:ubiquitin carboxyl-terminal hydrolase 8-like isoform X2 [Coccinella septempunctata]|uniref:ubiquitin carboxyl-terminal hydrolase 8-like isoform X2 n=1 Tax=Coccinella septempunctata TaxID=41139 RepID=UPI001D08912F|nr:ubiquitin carboxyl-terminal hydrolase 8-like isoform X2 [Coccinella septempunctata]
MPVLSPHHSSPSYRSSYNSTLDRPPYYSNTSINPRISSYSERFTTRSYIDSEGRRTISRSGSITEDGVKTRFKEEIRDGSTRRDSLSRDPGVSSIRENSVLDFGGRREGSLSRDSSRLSSVEIIDELADFRNKYSPSNYVPAIHRRNDNIGRSKSINDIGLPPIEKAKKKVTDGVNVNMSVPPNTTATNDNSCNNDDNGNRASVADLRKRFDKMPENKVSKSPVNIDTSEVKLSDNKFKILDQSNLKVNGEKIPNGLRTVKRSNLPKATIKKSPVKPDEAKGEENHVKIIKIAGVHKETEDQAKPNPKTQKINTDKQKNAIEKKTANTDKKINPTTEKRTISDKQKTKTVLSREPVDTVDSSNVKINSEQGKLTNGVADLKSNALDNGKETDEAQIKDQEDGAGSTESGHSLSEDSSSVGVSRTNNFASYISSKNLEGGDKESVVLVENSLEPKTGSVDRPVTYQKASSPKTNKNRLSPSSSVATNSVGTSGVLNSNSLGRKSLERERRSGIFDEDAYDSYRLGTGSPTNACAAATSVKTLGLNGLKNIGNTCFMNSVIQCLSNTRQLSEYLRQDAYIKDINTTNSSMKGSLIKAFAEVIKELWAEDSCDRAVNTASLKGQIQRFAPRFMGFAQQDAQEFLRYLLEGLHEDVNRVKEKPKPIHTEIDDKLNDLEKSAESWNRYLRMDNSRIVDIFVGQLKSTLKCTFCGHCSVTFDPFWDLSLPIPMRTGQLRLSQCLESFTREETLDGDEKPTCSKCKERRKCTKSFSIQKFPKILVIHLKRFSPTERFRGKLSVTVDFPLEGLDMSKYAAEEVTSSRYNLYAVSNHSGTTYSGHYTAYCRHPYAMSWHEYNDSRVSSVSPRSIVSSEAYVLFYEQEGAK